VRRRDVEALTIVLRSASHAVGARRDAAFWALAILIAIVVIARPRCYGSNRCGV